MPNFGGGGAEATAHPISVDSAGAILSKIQEIRVKMGETKEIMRSQPSTYGLSTNDGRRGLDRRTINGRRKFLVHRQTLTDKRTRSQSCLPYRGVSHEFQYLAPKISLIQWWPRRGRAGKGKGAGSLLTDYPFKRLDGWFFAWIMQNFAQMVSPEGGGGGWRHGPSHLSQLGQSNCLENERNLSENGGKTK